MVKVNYQLMEQMVKNILNAERKANDILDMLCQLNHSMNLDMDLLMQPSSSKILRGMLTAVNDMTLVHERLDALTKAVTGLSEEYQETEHNIQKMLDDRAEAYEKLETEFQNFLSPESDEIILEGDDTDQLKQLEKLLKIDQGNADQADASFVRKRIRKWYHPEQIISE